MNKICYSNNSLLNLCFRTPNFLMGGPSSLPNSGAKNSQSTLEEELMLFRLIDIQQQQPMSNVAMSPTNAMSPSCNVAMSPSSSAPSFTAVFREPTSHATVLNFG